MYCISCGVRLADTEKKCPLCGTVVYHPEIAQADAPPLYPAKQVPSEKTGRAFLSGAIIILFMIPLAVTFFSDILLDGRLDWFGFVAGGLTIAYLTFALPMWFSKPNPVIFVPCDIVASALYLLYVDAVTDGGWFLTLALPAAAGTAAITCTLVTLLYYLRHGRLYVIGGSLMALGGFVLMIELLVDLTFGIQFIGWSLYPLVSLFLFGGLLIYLAINGNAREKIERKLFF